VILNLNATIITANLVVAGKTLLVAEDIGTMNNLAMVVKPSQLNVVNEDIPKLSVSVIRHHASAVIGKRFLN